MLLANYAQVNRNTVRDIGVAFTNPHAKFKPAHFQAFYVGDHVVSGQTNKSGFNNGYSGQSAWSQPPKPGGLGSTNALRGVGTFTGAIAGGKNATASLTGSGSLSAVGQLIVSLAASIGGSGTITGAQLKAYLQLAAALSGSGTLLGTRSARANAAAALSGAGSLVGLPRAIGSLAAQITVTGTGLTTSNVGAAVWSALAALNNDPGTMGEKLNDAGSAANPWTESLPGAYVPGSAGYILGNLLAAIPPAVWAEGIAGTHSAEELMRAIAAAAAGKSSGHETNTPKYRDLDDTKDVIDATTDANGNRLTVTRDLT